MWACEGRADLLFVLMQLETRGVGHGDGAVGAALSAAGALTTCCGFAKHLGTGPIPTGCALRFWGFPWTWLGSLSSPPRVSGLSPPSRAAVSAPQASEGQFM